MRVVPSTRCAIQCLVRVRAVVGTDHVQTVLAYPPSPCVQGEFVGNKYHGYGSFTFPDGSVYEGSFKDNQMHGKGVYTDAQGVEWKGKFYNGVGPGLAAGTVVAK